MLSTLNTLPAQNFYGTPQAVTVGASPFVLTNTNPCRVMVTIGGVLTLLEYQQNWWDPSQWESLYLNPVAYLGAGDSLRITYLVTPIVRWFPF